MAVSTIKEYQHQIDALSSTVSTINNKYLEYRSGNFANADGVTYSIKNANGAVNGYLVLKGYGYTGNNVLVLYDSNWSQIWAVSKS